MIKKIGFACILSEINPKKGIISIPTHSFKTTTISWLNRQSKEVAVERLWQLMEHNIQAAYNLVSYVGNLSPHLRMVRLGSDCLPAYTHTDWKWFWKSADVQTYCETQFIKVGDLARANDVRLSMHPGQFCVLASVSENIVNNSIEEFEYHADMARWMGYGKSFQDFKINVHISGKAGPEGIRSAYQRLTPEARSCITIENEENAWGLDDCLTISDLVPIVLDVHHNWIKTSNYIQPSDANVSRVVDSWRGIRPTMHYSISREDYLINHSTTVMPDYNSLLESGHQKQKLRAHSDAYWNTAVNEWALGFLNTHDILCESKSKNLASFELANQALALGLL